VRWVHRIAAVGFAALLSLFLISGTAFAAGETISGTIKVLQTGKSVENAKVTVTDSNGAAAGEATTDADGRFTVKVDKPGAFTVKLDLGSLPKGVVLNEGSTATRSVVVQEGGSQGVIFSLSDGSKASSSFDWTFLQRGVEGIRYGLIIAICAIGLSLIFGTTGLTNFAHGELVTIGAFAAYVVNAKWGLPLALAMVAAVVVGIGVGAANDLAIWRPLRKRRSGLIAMLVVSIGLGMALRYFMLLIAGGDRQYYDTPAQTGIDVGPITVVPRDLIAMALCLAVLVAVAVMLQKTKIGKAMRAVADNRDLAASSGINVDRVILFVWMLGGGLAAFGGVIYGWTVNLRFDMGFGLLLLMFAGVTLGGLGTAYGALLGSLIIGVIVQESTLIIPDDIKTTAGLLLLILILIVRPSGLLGARQRIG
jgi:branched-chain amino acid transport system permease protein